jgi:hypothetical protein
MSEDDKWLWSTDNPPYCRLRHEPLRARHHRLDRGDRRSELRAKGRRLARPIPTPYAVCQRVRLAHANHYVFMSNEADVLREMRAFLSNLN